MYAYIFRSGFWRKQFARPSQCSKFHSIAHPLNAANEFMEKRQLYLDLCGLSSSFASTALCFSSKGDSLLKLTVRSFSAEMLKEEDADDINDDKASAPKLGIWWFDGRSLNSDWMCCFCCAASTVVPKFVWNTCLCASGQPCHTWKPGALKLNPKDKSIILDSTLFDQKTDPNWTDQACQLKCWLSCWQETCCADEVPWSSACFRVCNKKLSCCFIWFKFKFSFQSLQRHLVYFHSFLAEQETRKFQFSRCKFPSAQACWTLVPSSLKLVINILYNVLCWDTFFWN